MIRYVPQYLLYVESHSVSLSGDSCEDDCLRPDRLGHWRFILESLDDLGRLEVADEEPGVWGPRLALLATVRGLEALEQPSRVTLIARSLYLNDRFSRLAGGSADCSAESTTSPWQDRYQNADLWQRLQGALGYHNVECRNWRLDGAHDTGHWHVNADQPLPGPSRAIASMDQWNDRDQPRGWQPNRVDGERRALAIA